MTIKPKRAMLLAAGLGLRMRPLTETTPKPLVKLADKPLIDYVLDRLAAAGVERVVVNTHYLAPQIERHVASRGVPKVVLSDETGTLLDTGGGVVKALPSLGTEPFYICNADSISIPGGGANLARMAAAFDPRRMDCLMLLSTAATSLGYDGNGDFFMAADGLLKRRGEREIAPFAFTGTSLNHPRLFADAPPGKFSLNLLWDRAMAQGRLFGIRQDGLWMHIGSPDALKQAEQMLCNGEAYF
jgi:N-acetyl-alpha-D-muramate 1-phosphate uridylyltransferase